MRQAIQLYRPTSGTHDCQVLYAAKRTIAVQLAAWVNIFSQYGNTTVVTAEYECAMADMIWQNSHGKDTTAEH